MIQSFVLNPFPELLAFGLLGVTILRVVAGVLFIRRGHSVLKKNTSSAVSWIDILGGVALVLGLYTQIAATVLGLRVITLWLTKNQEKKLTTQQSDLYALLLAICVSLLLTGAGLFALDLPL